MEAVRRMKEGKCEEAVHLLHDANMRYKNEPEADFNVQMALVEILILLVIILLSSFFCFYIMLYACM